MAEMSYSRCRFSKKRRNRLSAPDRFHRHQSTVDEATIIVVTLLHRLGAAATDIYCDSQAYGQTECTPCPVGTFGRSSGADTCEVCPEGTYQDQVCAYDS